MDINLLIRDLDFFARPLDWEHGEQAVAPWHRHLKEWSFPLSATRAEEVLRAHGTADRHYHNLVHIVGLLDWIRDLQLDAATSQRLVWTAVYHDIVYDTRRTDNEAASAEVAEEDMRALGIPGPDIEWVSECIRRTAGHQGNGADEAMRLFLDLDLLVLAAPSATYLRYAAAIRKEYGWVPIAAYQEGRTRVLRHFLDRPKIYFSEGIAERFDNQARNNMEAELVQWKG